MSYEPGLMLLFAVEFSATGCAAVVRPADGDVDVDGMAIDQPMIDRPLTARDADSAAILADVDVWLPNVDVVADAAVDELGPPLPFDREARISVIHAMPRSSQKDSVSAAIVVPRRADGTGVARWRSGDCVVENTVGPATEPIAERVFYRTRNQETELARTDSFGFLNWESFTRPFVNGDPVTIRAQRAGVAMPWEFTAPIPAAFTRLTAPSGVDQVPMSTMILAPTGSIPIAWDPSPNVTEVQIEYTSFHYLAATMQWKLSTIRCLYDPSIRAVTLVPSAHPAWRFEDFVNDSVLLNIDSIVRYEQPFGERMVKVEMIHRQAQFSIAYRRQ